MGTSTWEHLQKYPKDTQRLLGIDRDKLQDLILLCRDRHHQKKLEDEKQKVRLIKKGGGKPPKLEIEEQIILTLFYLRQGVTFQTLALHFDVSESTAHNYFCYWQSILEEVLPASLMLQIKKYELDKDEFLEILENYQLIVDSSEQPRQRPESSEEQKKWYSGKKKNHTFKNQLIVLPSGKDIVDISVGCLGKTSDITLFRRQQSLFSKQQKFMGDKAYVGEDCIEAPHKKPRNGELSQKQKEENKLLSSVRIFVEHIIGMTKMFPIARERFRLKPHRYSSIVKTICGLVRMRLGKLKLQFFERGDRLLENGQISSLSLEELLVRSPSNPEDFVLTLPILIGVREA